MEAKDKAKALVSEFYSLISGMPKAYILENWDVISKNTSDNYFVNSIQCALIECAEVLKQWEYVEIGRAHV